MDEIQLEYDIPIPPPLEKRRTPRKRVSKYGALKAAIGRMLPGDSFVYPNDRRYSVILAAREMGVKVSARSLGDGNARFWRVDDSSVIE